MIDISSLDKETKAKFEKFAERSKELTSDGAVLETVIPIKLRAGWYEGVESMCDGENSYEIDYLEIERLQKELKYKTDKEILEIMEFVGSTAETLNVDENNLFNEYFI